ncbi:MAG: hypothetical protein CL902_00765 [Dehalococcoidia bacterium]|nr:hypothetical protein [Dehalococcoidia bacterium]
MATSNVIFLWWIFAMTIAILLGCAMTHCACREEDSDEGDSPQSPQSPQRSTPPPLEEAVFVVVLPSSGLAVVVP